MSTPTASARGRANRSMPPGTIIPELVYDDLDSAVAWLCGMLGFKERLRIRGHRVQLVLNGASVIAIASASGSRGGLSMDHSIIVRVEDVDAHFDRVRKSAATIVSAPADYPYGERHYTIADPSGRHWTCSQSIADVDPAEWGGVLVEST